MCGKKKMAGSHQGLAELLVSAMFPQGGRESVRDARKSAEEEEKGSSPRARSSPSGEQQAPRARLSVSGEKSPGRRGRRSKLKTPSSNRRWGQRARWERNELSVAPRGLSFDAAKAKRSTVAAEGGKVCSEKQTNLAWKLQLPPPKTHPTVLIHNLHSEGCKRRWTVSFQSRFRVPLQQLPAHCYSAFPASPKRCHLLCATHSPICQPVAFPTLAHVNSVLFRASLGQPPTCTLGSALTLPWPGLAFHGESEPRQARPREGKLPARTSRSCPTSCTSGMDKAEQKAIGPR